MKVADESVSKVLDWFKRSSGTEDRKRVSARSQGREPNEEVDFSTRTAVVPTEDSGPKTGGKPEVKEELPFGKMKQQKSSSSTSLISKDKKQIKERMKPKKEEENEEQNDKSLTEFDCPRAEEKEHENILKETTLHSNQCKVSERRVEQSHDVSPADQTEEISKSTGKVDGPSADEHENKKSLRRLFREFEPFCLRYQAADKDDTLGGSQWPQAGLQNLLGETCASQPPEYRKVGMKTSDDTNSVSQPNCSIESTHQEDTGQPEEVNETTEKFVAPSKVSGLSSALEKLMKEASETPPPKPKRAISTVQRTAEVEFKSTTYGHDGELPQEIRETIGKSVAPSRVNSLSSALEKLLKEASETPPPKPKRAISAVQRTAEVGVESTTYEDDGELPQEIREAIEKCFAPSKHSTEDC
ncbi:synaptotagmin-like protein 2 isoform x1 [Limosa lapponica baueri]|uniref:Synaptotagmin-like protein 2 isoform x1 n=1 Tax=Limosa lapponica baueri TaxID=1758121 RepID=A0A2I0T1L9_LIMLA|nr:synaptotagmin-like protein 2 isoform x1 [Limosa lapponica baueri]